jgi:hypothetical protein
MILISVELQLHETKRRFAGRARWYDPQLVLQLHQLGFDTAQRVAAREKKNE